MLDPLEVKSEIDTANAMESEDKLIVKIMYKSKIKAIYAAMLITIDLLKKKIVNKYLALSHEPDFLKIVNEESTYAEVHKAITEKKADNLIPIEKLTDVEQKIAGIFTTQVIETLNVYDGDNTDKDEYFEVISNIKSVISNTLEDDNAYIAIGMEKVDKSVIENVDNKEAADKAAIDDDYADIMKKEKQAISKVASTLVLSPVYGTAIANIEPGDVVMAIVENSTPTGKGINKQLETVEQDGKVHPIPALVVKKMTKPNKKGVTLIIKISDGIYSTIEEADPIKVQTYDDIKFDKDKGGSSTSHSAMNVVLVVLALTVFVVVAVVIYLNIVG